MKRLALSADGVSLTTRSIQVAVGRGGCRASSASGKAVQQLAPMTVDLRCHMIMPVHGAARAERRPRSEDVLSVAGQGCSAVMESGLCTPFAAFTYECYKADN